MRSNQLHFMAECRQLTCGEVGSRTGLHHHRASRQVTQQPHHLLPGRLLTEDLTSGLVLPVQMEAVLAEIDTYQCNCAHDDGLRE